MEVVGKSVLLEITYFFFFFMSLDFHENWCSRISTCLYGSQTAVGYMSTWMGNYLSALLLFLMVLQLTLVEQKTFWPCLSCNYQYEAFQFRLS